MKELSDQTRAIIAAALALVVIVGWNLVFKPPASQQTTRSTSSSSSTNVPTASGNAPGTLPSIGSGSSTTPAAPAAAAPSSADQAASEKTIVIESELYRIELSNRGAVVHSWQLKKYTDEGTPPHTLDIVNAGLSKQTGGWPLALQVNDPQIESSVNQALYVVSTPSGTSDAQGILQAPAEIDFHWSDGQIEVTKTLKFDHTYVAQLATSVRRNGQAIGHRIGWRGGFGDVTAYRAALQTTVFSGDAGSISVVATKKLGAPNQTDVSAEQPGSFDAVGIEDLYFAAAFLPAAPAPGQAVQPTLTLAGRQIAHDFLVDGKTQKEVLPEMSAATTSAGPLDLRLYVGPKDVDGLKSMRPPLNNLVSFGWTSFIGEPLFYILRWVHKYIPNYGWAIILMTIGINMLLYPLKVKSWRSMQKMQKVMPEVRSIQDRFKKYGMRDPRKQEMNKEVMAVYSREGINPMGSCLPQVVQLPIWFGLYRMLNITIELRHAPWVGWLHDLSGRDPYYILPLVMTALMFAVTKMTPMTGTDPSQQRMMAFMPLVFGGMFLLYPVSSGLVLYIITSNLIALIQQWYLNRTSPLKSLVVKGKRK